MMIIANPIYDVVFKFMMEDEKVAKILLSALLKKEVVELKMKNQEFSKMYESRISLFRLDFSARVKNADGSENLVIIELQKTWLDTETLRFRQYLGYQYIDKSNIIDKSNTLEEPKLSAVYGLPIISIYILGHKLGDLEEPVIYVKRNYLDYESKIINKGVPDKFIESLTHDSIIVQIPYLKGRVKNKLEKILSVFDQKNKIEYDTHFLEIDEKGMDEESQLIVRRLSQAMATPDVIRAMQIEDEFLCELENRDTSLMVKDQKIQEKDQKIQEKDQKIQEQKDFLKATINLLINNGLSAAEISKELSISSEKILSIIKQSNL